jgi:hypothetical protein
LSAAHAGCAQMPFVHVPLQQSLLDWHALPEAAHVALLHCPAVHTPLQQSPAFWQAA